MPARAGIITEMYEDGTCKVRATNEEATFFGRLVVMSGGMVVFDVVDHRSVTVSQHGVVQTDTERQYQQPEQPEAVEDPGIPADATQERRQEKRRVGVKR